MSAIVTKITTKRFNFEMTDTVTNAKQRAITAQNARLKKRIAELTGKETSPKPQIKEAAALVYKRRDDGYRTYHTFEGDPVAAAEAAVKVLAPYTWKGVNPYSPQTEDPIDIGDGNVRIIASHCSSV